MAMAFGACETGWRGLARSVRAWVVISVSGVMARSACLASGIYSKRLLESSMTASENIWIKRR